VDHPRRELVPAATQDFGSPKEEGRPLLRGEAAPPLKGLPGLLYGPVGMFLGGYRELTYYLRGVGGVY